MNLLDLARSSLSELSTAAADIPARQWRIRFPGGSVMTVLFIPAATRADVMDVYPGAEVEPADEAPDSEGLMAPDLVDLGVLQRRARALAILDQRPELRVAVVAEHGDPARVAVAVRGVAVADLEVPAGRYDAFALLSLMQQYGTA